MDPLLLALRKALSADLSLVHARWMDESIRRCWQLRQRPELAQELRNRCEFILQALADAVADSPRLQVGDQRFREPVKLLSFVAGWLVGVDLPIGAGIALCHGLQAALNDESHTFFQQLEVAVAESYVAGQREKAHARHKQVIKKSQVVCMLPNATAALVVVGDPGRETLEDAVGRLMMLALMRAARYLLVDVSTLSHPETVLPKLFELLAAHRGGLVDRELGVFLTGLSEAQFEEHLPQPRAVSCQRFETIEAALERAGTQ